jgi:hypothetical protein
MSWNPVLNKFIEIKQEYIRRLGYITYYYTDGYTNETETCLERWVSELNGIEPYNNYKEYEDFISCLELNQHEHLLLFRYARYSNAYDGETEVSGEDFWDKYDGIYRECRSLVIDVAKDCIVLCPMKKFWNLNELEETSLENIQNRIKIAKTIEFSDKLDGSMQSARWYDGKIVMSGSQALNPEKSWRLQDGYRMINSLHGYKQMLMKFPDCTFIFEYISLKDAHVVKYTKEQEGLYLIGIRDIADGTELDYNLISWIAWRYGIPTTKLFDKTLEQVLSELDDKSSDEAEGFVINIDGYRVKVKYTDYVFIHRALSKLSSVNLIIHSIADETFDDLLSKLPMAYHNNVKKVAKVVIDYIRKTEKTIAEYYSVAPKGSKKEFMVWIAENVPKEYQGYCRELYYGRKINVLKNGNETQPHYKKLKDMGVNDYNEIFEEV